MIQITSIDSVWSKVNREGYLILNQYLSYTKVYWQNTGWKKVRKEYTKYLCHKSGKEYIFLTGLVQRCLLFLQENGYNYKYDSDVPTVNYDSINLPGIKLRDYQEEIVDSAVHSGRGVIQAPTGTGKSICIAGIISCFSMENVLLLCHNTSIVKQLYDTLKEHNFDPYMISTKNPLKKRVMCSTIQTFKRVVMDYTEWFDVVIVDEAHHCVNIEGKNYGYSLQRLAASVRLGFTATLPESVEDVLSLEALIGPVIHQYTNQQATDDKILAKPKIYMFDTVCPPEVLIIKDYRLQYKFGITNNGERNKLIVETAIKFIKENKSTLILVKQIEHGTNLEKLFSKYGHKVSFIKGETSSEERENLKEKLKNGEILCLIASTIWVEGLDIPALNCLINASGGKSDLVSTQRIGRVLRRTDTKTEAVIIDFLDWGKYLKRHSKQRLNLYKKSGWEIIY